MQTDRLALTLIFRINFQLSEEEKRPFLQPITSTCTYGSIPYGHYFFGQNFVTPTGALYAIVCHLRSADHKAATF